MHCWWHGSCALLQGILRFFVGCQTPPDPPLLQRHNRGPWQKPHVALLPVDTISRELVLETFN